MESKSGRLPTCSPSGVLHHNLLRIAAARNDSILTALYSVVNNCK